MGDETTKILLVAPQDGISLGSWNGERISSELNSSYRNKVSVKRVEGPAALKELTEACSQGKPYSLVILMGKESDKFGNGLGFWGFVDKANELGAKTLIFGEIGVDFSFSDMASRHKYARLIPGNPSAHQTNLANALNSMIGLEPDGIRSRASGMLSRPDVLERRHRANPARRPVRGRDPHFFKGMTG